MNKNIPSTLLEFDPRFISYENFYQYDYNFPLNLPCHLEGKFDVIIVDPPFLSEECLTKICVTVKWLSAKTSESKIILCTGQWFFHCKIKTYIVTGKVQEELAYKLLNVKPCEKFEPKHESRLSNEFGCFVNFDPVSLNK